jgi:hypothetical protein
VLTQALIPGKHVAEIHSDTAYEMHALQKSTVAMFSQLEVKNMHII